MTFEERLAAIRAAMQAQGLDRLIAIHDGAHFIEKPNPVTVLTGFKALGASAAVLAPGEDVQLVVTPVWEQGAADVVSALAARAGLTRGGRIGIAGLSALPWDLAEPLSAALPQAVVADDVVFEPARTKTDAEIAHAREATRFAEAGYARLLDDKPENIPNRSFPASIGGVPTSRRRSGQTPDRLPTSCSCRVWARVPR